MEKKIGTVILDYKYYKGKDLYSEGTIEDFLLECVRTEQIETCVQTSNEWAVLYHFSTMRENLLEWIDFGKDAEVLEIGAGCGALTGILSRKCRSVTCVELSEKRSMVNAYRNKNCDNIRILLGNFEDIYFEQKFDYVTLVGVLEYAGLYISSKDPYNDMIKKIKNLLKPNGKIIIAIENKMGMKYFNGAFEDHTWKLYSGLNDYTDEKDVRTFSKQEIKKMLFAADIKKVDFFYPMPDYKIPEIIWSDKCMAKESEVRTYRKNYDKIRLYNFYEATAFDQVCADAVFDYFANSFLVITDNDADECIYSKYGRNRKEEFQICTTVEQTKRGKIVRKRALNSKAEKHILQIFENEQKWYEQFPNLTYVRGFLENKSYVINYIEGDSLSVKIFSLRNDEIAFIEFIHDVLNRYLKPPKESLSDFYMTEDFKMIFGNQDIKNKTSLKISNVDLAFNNLILNKDELVNFDYEWVFDFPIPFGYVYWRMLDQLYTQFSVYLRKKISRRLFLNEFEFSNDDIGLYTDMEKHFSEYVCGNDYLHQYEKDVIMQNITLA